MNVIGYSKNGTSKTNASLNLTQVNRSPFNELDTP